MATQTYKHPISGEQAGKLGDGEPCSHKGCSHHVTHPCEVCGRTAARGEAWAPTRNFPTLPSKERSPLTEADLPSNDNVDAIQMYNE